MFVPPYDVACRCCKAARGNVCRSRISGEKLTIKGKAKCHDARWNDHFQGKGKKK